VDVDDASILDDINVRKEFQMLSKEHIPTGDQSIIPHFMMEKGKHLRLRSYQLFARNFLSPDTPYNRLLVLHDMGTGKTTTGIAIAMEYIKYFKQNIKGTPQPFVYIVGFTRAQFERDLFRFAEFGFITRAEYILMNKLRQSAQTGSEADADAYREFKMQLRRRLGNQKGNGFIKFVGYKELANDVFVSNKNVATMSAADIVASLADKSLVINYEYVAKFKNCLLICDEIHNVYNSLSKNNWGVALQIVLNEHGKNIRAAFLTGTVLKNAQTEIVDVLNLIAGTAERTYARSEFFDKNDQLLSTAVQQISDLARGRVSFLVDVNPTRYPSQSYSGTMIPGTPYLSFVRTTMSKLQNDTYIAIKDDKSSLHEHAYIFDMVFPNPTGKLGLFKSSQLRMLEIADDAWRKKNGISVNMDTMTISGSILHESNIATYSGKYPAMLKILEESRKNGAGKSFIYHKFVHMTGVFLIGNIMSANGYVSLNVPANTTTKCALCEYTMETHPKNTHSFSAARYILIHGEMNKKTISNQLEAFNASDNIDGSKILCIVGARIMREAFDLSSVRNVFVVTRPDNIPSLLQIIARSVRAGSHQQLSADKQNVTVHILTSMTISGEMTYEELKYVQKVKDYIVIQSIERALHASALDSVINRGIIEPALVKNDIGHLYFEPGVKIIDNLRPEDMNMSTFNVYHLEYEVIDIIYIIKRLFMNHSSVWSQVDLWKSVKDPPFGFEYDATLFSYSSFVLAVERLLWADDYFVNQNSGSINMLDILQDESDKRIMLPGSVIGVIVQIGEYYMAVPINPVTKKPDIYIDAPFRLPASGRHHIIDVTDYTRSILTVKRFNDLKIMFIEKFKNKSIAHMADAICIHGHDFHVLLIEEVILYIFNLWTNPKQIASKEFNSFYFQMLYYYDAMGLIVWMNSAKNSALELYDDYNKTISIKKLDNTNSLLPKKYDNTRRGELIHIIRSIERSNCSWCPDTVKSRYNNAINMSKERFAAGASLTATDDMIPIGHFIDEAPRFYHPERNWFSLPEYIQDDGTWKENEIIIGFDTRSTGGLHIRFRMRNPRQKIKHHKDSRLAERGIMCTSRSKPFLLTLLKKLGVKGTFSKSNTPTICSEIRARLMYLELLERAKGSNIKWYYNQFEQGGPSLI
jgi:hypothetical protein